MDWVDYREKLGIGFCDEEKFKYFKRKIFNVLNALAKDAYSVCMDIDEYYAFCDTTGMSMNMNYTQDYCSSDRFEHCLSIIERTSSLGEFLAFFVALVNAVKTKKHSENYWTRVNFSNLLCDKLTQSHISFDLLEDREEYFIFPKGSREMDDALVSQPLDWLAGYPKAHTAFIKALKEYSEATPDNASDIADKFRKTLETFFQEFFVCDKSLENCKGLYGSYLKSQNVPPEIAANFETLLQAYTNFMNGYAKHHDKTGLNVLEYIMYQTGNIIRLLITLKHTEQSV